MNAELEKFITRVISNQIWSNQFFKVLNIMSNLGKIINLLIPAILLEF
jgi:hypothetical protein